MTTRLDATRGRVDLEVRDTGPGIPPEIQLPSERVDEAGRADIVAGFLGVR